MADFGITFKTARESRGLTLEQVATKTKIGTRFLEAIESEQFERLPGGIFSRGFVRSYAESLGLNADEVVASFDRMSNYIAPAVIQETPLSTPKTQESGGKLFPIAIAIGVIIGIVFYFATRQSTPAVTADQTPRAAAQPAPPSDKPPETPAAPLPGATAAGSTDVAASPAPDQTPATAEHPKEALALVLEAREATWVKVLADGAAVNPGEVLQPGTTRRYTAQNSIDLMVGNAGGVNVKVNDHEVRSLGKGGQVKSITITPENLKDIIG